MRTEHKTPALTSLVSQPNTHSCPALGLHVKAQVVCHARHFCGRENAVAKPSFQLTSSGHPEQRGLSKRVCGSTREVPMLTLAHQLWGDATHGPVPKEAFLRSLRIEAGVTLLALRISNGEDRLPQMFSKEAISQI